ncbi:MAG: alpha-amylase family protein [Promicromonosporaceae bacterium]|nr:alpha-amylase family protein [Promicromonosporaceae bacterium]
MCIDNLDQQSGGPTGGWHRDTIWWHVYPLGFTGAPIRPGEVWLDHTGKATVVEPNDEPAPRGLRHLSNWLDYAQNLGCNGLLLGPIFTSQSHGYDTVDYFQIDPRLGTMEDFEALVTAASERGIRIMLDGVFSHVGHHHPWLQADLSSGDRNKDLFDIDWDAHGGPRPRVWEGHGGLARLNHASGTARDLVKNVMTFWLDKGIAGWRLDAAYSVPADFWAEVVPAVREQFPDAYFLGEVIHGDYTGFVKNARIDTVTQYELWKSIWSALKDANFFELDWTLKRHNDLLGNFIPQTFVGNHDVTRIATQIGHSGALAAATVLATVGGSPSIYYGDEQGMTGTKENRLGGDDAVRPAFPPAPQELNDLAGWMYHAHQGLLNLRRRHPWLVDATTTPLSLENARYTFRVTSRDGQNWLDVTLDAAGEPGNFSAQVHCQDGGQIFSS